MKFTQFRTPLIALLLFALIIPILMTRAGAQTAGPIQPSGTQPPPAQQAPEPPKPAPPPQTSGPGFAISISVPVVNVDVVATDSDGNYVQGLKKENFRVTEDGAPQIITNFSKGDAPITVALLVEYSRLGYGSFLYDAKNWADVFLHELKKDDWIALESFNMKTSVEVDFTHSAADVEEGLGSLNAPTFSESNIFDAVSETVDRMRDVKGKKAILLLASGTDTFSKLTLDKTLERLKENDVTIFCVGVGEQLALEVESHGGVDLGTNSLSHQQADNQLKAFASLTGGRSWFPRFNTEVPSVMSDVAASLRNQYSLAYTPSNQATDGKYRKIKVEIVDTDGKPMTLYNEKGKKIKYQVYSRQGYYAPKSSIIN